MPLPALLLAVPALAFAPIADEPAELTVQPAAVTLTGPRDACQLVVTGRYADGSIRDLTHAVTVATDRPGVVAAGDGLFLRGTADGSATITLTAGRKSVRVPVTVAAVGAAAPVSFRNDVMAVFNVGGCNMGACHGTPSGKNGFKLSLRGAEPAADYLALTREQFGRRTDSHDPDGSLLLLKGLGRVPHEGAPGWGPTATPPNSSAAGSGRGFGTTRRRCRRSSRWTSAPARGCCSARAKRSNWPWSRPSRTAPNGTSPG